MLLTTLWIGALLAPAPTDEPELDPGDAVPDFELVDLDGRARRLSEQRGRIVVLEWTSPLCPSVASWHESGLGADTRAAVAGDDVVWWRIDSSFFVTERRDVARAWCERLALRDPFLLDPDGTVARALGARATPHLFVVDAAGRLAYRGAPTERADEHARRNFVVAAVDALRAGERPRPSTTAARGCSVKLDRGEGWTVDDFDEEREARVLYERAAREAAAGADETALELLARAFERGLSWPTRVLADARFGDLLRADERRERVRALLGERPARRSLRIVAPDEPGQPLVLSGTVRDPDGRPVPRALVSLYQTDDAGWYAPGSSSGRNARLFGRVVGDDAGRWRVRTVVPGYYADSDGNGLRHVHIGFRAEGYEPFEGHRASLYFRDDPNLVGDNLAEIRSDGCAILERRPNAEGVTSVVYPVVLERE